MQTRQEENIISRSRKPSFFSRLYVQLIFLGALALFFSILMFTWRIVDDQSQFAFDSISEQASTLARNISSAAGNYMVTEDFGALEQLLLQAASYKDVSALRVLDENGYTFSSVIRNSSGIPEPVYQRLKFQIPETPDETVLVQDDFLIVLIPVENGTLGWTRLDYSLASITDIRSSLWRDGLATAFVALLVSIVLLVLLLRRPMSAIGKATEFARQLYKNTGEVMPVESATFEIEQLEYALNYASRSLFDTNKDLSDFKLALDSHAIVGITDRDGNLTYVNDAFCNISGYRRDELLGNKYNILNSGRHSADFYKEMWQTISSGETWRGELEDRSKDGELYWVETTIVPFVDDEGAPYQYMGLQTDITERIRTEEVNVRLGRILDESINEIYIFDSESLKFLQVNKGARENLGYTIEELKGLAPYDIKPEYTADEFIEFIKPLRDGERNVLSFETLHERKNGTTYPVEIILQLSTIVKPHVFVAMVQDITERRKSELELQEYQLHLQDMVEERTDDLKLANRELESFCYSVSHDLRAPLRSIDGFSQALLEDCSGTLDEEAKDYLGRVRASSQRMGELIDDLLNLSKVVRSEMNISEVRIGKLVRRVAEQLQAADSSRKNVRFSIDESLLARGDQRLILAMLENLLGNAWKFTAKEDNAMIEFGAIEHDNGHAFYVKDNGAGFDEKYVHKLFEPFQRLHSMHEYEGSGIGLATVQRIIRRHGGDVWAEGEVGVGATIFFTLGDNK